MLGMLPITLVGVEVKLFNKITHKLWKSTKCIQL